MSNANVVNFMANVDGNSWLHRLDPRSKVAILLFFSTLPLLFTNPWFIVGFILMSLPLWATAKLNYRSLAAPLAAAGIFMVMIFIFSMIRPPSSTQPGGGGELTRADAVQGGATGEATGGSPDTWRTQIGPLIITQGTLMRSFFLATRLFVPLTIGLLIISTTDPTYMAKGLRKLKMPIEIVFMALAGLRFVPIVTEQIFNILDAQTVRGLGKSRLQRVKLLMMPLFISSLRRTRTMGLACEARGFGAHKWNTFLDEFRLLRADKVMLAVLGILAVVALVVRYGLGIGAEYLVAF